MEEPKPQNPHDRYFNYSFSIPSVARSFVESHFPAEIGKNLDWATLRIVSGTFVDEQLRLSQSDVLFEVDLLETAHDKLIPSGAKVKSKKGRQSVFVYLLFEHKSYEDPLLPFQLLKYEVRIWERQLRNGMPLSVILPIVIYHGASEWKTHRSLEELLAAPETFQVFMPRFSFPLLDLGQTPDEELAGEPFLQISLRLLKYIQAESDVEKLQELLAFVVNRIELPKDAERLDAIIIYLLSAAPKLDQIEMSEAIRNVFHDLGNPLPGTIGEKLVLQGRKEGLDEGRKAGLEAGREAGLLAGKIELIQQLLGVPVLSRERLLNLSGDEMSSLLEELQMTLREQGRH